MSDVFAIVWWTIVVVAIVLALVFPVRLVACLFSDRVRRAVRERRFLHVAWGLLSFAVLAFSAYLYWFVSQHAHASTRAQVQEGFLLARPLKMRVEELWREHGKLPSHAAELAAPSPDTFSGSYTESVTAGDGGALVIRFADTTDLPADARQRSIVLVPRTYDTELRWNCTGGDLPEKYRPRECRD